ncbi:MAG: hypothetical protein F2825_05755 [Actinobacteria bacterium]|jgi:hypothetical protein|uniref:Unannotated protein n=1 Tax=freshwater metagenome TaxID=449393 RepID=A0A6J7HFV9_9ZZZZ|nr:hypothetical protein [Actinomycetota bacterium]
MERKPSWTAVERLGFVLGVVLLFAAVGLLVRVLASGGDGVAWLVVVVVVGFGTLVAVQLSRVRRLGRMRHNRRTGSGSNWGSGGTGL